MMFLMMFKFQYKACVGLIFLSNGLGFAVF